jgi:hypothetical protein
VRSAYPGFSLLLTNQIGTKLVPSSKNPANTLMEAQVAVSDSCVQTGLAMRTIAIYRKSASLY